MSTIVTVSVREDRPDFHGQIAHIAVHGDGSPLHFEVAKRLAMVQARENLPAAARYFGVKPSPGVVAPVVPAI